MGTSTMVGHYVCHIKKEGRWVIYNDEKVALSENPPRDLAYLYLYQRQWCHGNHLQGPLMSFCDKSTVLNFCLQQLHNLSLNIWNNDGKSGASIRTCFHLDNFNDLKSNYSLCWIIKWYVILIIRFNEINDSKSKCFLFYACIYIYNIDSLLNQC